MNRRNVLFILENRIIVFVVVSLLGIFCFCGCGKEEVQESAGIDEEVMIEETEEVKQSVAEETIVEEFGEVQMIEMEIEVESTEETITEGLPVEMVDFETWAKQGDNEEVCLVVWNDLEGRQEILPTLQESKKTYEIKDGDRFAIPYRKDIIYIDYMDEKLMWENYEYLELSLDKTGKVFEVFIGYEDQDGDGKNESVCYSFQ